MLRMRKGAWRANTTRGSSVGSSAIWRVEGATGKPRPAPPAQRRSCCMKPITSKMTARWVSLASPGSNSAWSMPDVMGGSVVGEVWRRGFKGTDCVVGVGVAGGWRRGSHQHQSIGQSQWGGGGYGCASACKNGPLRCSSICAPHSTAFSVRIDQRHMSCAVGVLAWCSANVWEQERGRERKGSVSQSVSQSHF